MKPRYHPAFTGRGLLPVATTVLGEEIRTDGAGEMREAIVNRLFDRFATTQTAVETHRHAAPDVLSVSAGDALPDLSRRVTFRVGLRADRRLRRARKGSANRQRGVRRFRAAPENRGLPPPSRAEIHRVVSALGSFS